jgi:hypothetical protein
MAASMNQGRAVPGIFAHMPQSLQASLMSPAYLSATSTAPVIPIVPHVSRPASPERPVIPNLPILDPSLDVTSIKRIKDLESQIQALKSDNDHQVSRSGEHKV